MQRNLLLGLQAGPALNTSKTWPGAGEIVLLRLAGLIWSTSDFAHQVTTAAALLIAQYLGQCRVRNEVDIAAGLVLCTISAQYEGFSKRLVPEVVRFLSRHISSLTSAQDVVKKGASTDNSAALTTTRPDILAILCRGKVDDTTRNQLCSAALDLSSEVYSRQTSLPSFEECFAPLASALEEIAPKVSAVPIRVSESS